MNALLGNTTLDVCLRKVGESAYPERPLFASSGGLCPGGVAPSKYTVPLHIEVGTYNVKFVEAGHDCTSDGPELGKVSLEADRSTTLLAYGSSLSKAKISALLDAKSEEGATLRQRFVNAVEGSSALDVGMADAKQNVYISPMFASAPLGGVGLAGKQLSGFSFASADELGYSTTSGNNAVLDYVLGMSRAVPDPNGPTGTHLLPKPGDPVQFTRSAKFSVRHTYTIFGLGSLDNQSFPARLWVCDETASDGLFARCGTTTSLKLGIWDPDLTDRFTDFNAERRPLVLQEINRSDADVLCLTDVYSSELHAELGKLSNFPHQIYSSEVEKASKDVSRDLRDASGAQPVFEDSACTGVLGTTMTSIVECLLDPKDEFKCLDRSQPGRSKLPVGESATSCMMNCGVVAAPLLGAAQTDLKAARCWMCALTTLADYDGAVEDVTPDCITPWTESAPRLAFKGKTGVGILSRFPLRGARVIHLPASDWNRGAVGVTITPQTGEEFDLWCGSMVPLRTEVNLPYGGVYGQGKTGTAAFLNEQILQTQRLIAGIKADAAKANPHRPTFVALSSNSGPAYSTKGASALVAVAPQNYEALTRAFTPLTPVGYTPVCTNCNANPINTTPDSTAGSWITHLFSYSQGFEILVDETAPIFVRPVVTLPVSGVEPAPRCPASEQYGLMSRVKFTQ